MSSAELSVDVDLVVAHMISLFHSVDTKPKGFPIAETKSVAKGKTLLIQDEYQPFLQQSRVFDTFQGFFESQKTGLSAKVLAQWFTRYQLRWTCSSLCCLFDRFVVPELFKANITHVKSRDGRIIHLQSLCVSTIFFQQPSPSKQHTLHFNCTGTDETIEQGVQDGILTHNVLICDKTKVVIDFSVGQFTGDMAQPRVYANVDEMEKSGAFPGPVLSVRPSPRASIDGQIGRERSLALAYPFLPDKQPERFAKRVVSSIRRGWEGICRECFGASTSLKICTRCRRVKYCGKHCQKRAWRREHKYNCKKLNVKKDTVGDDK